MINWLKKIYRKELFEPNIIGLFINPFYFARKGLHQHILELAPYLSGRLLDVGCGVKPYEKFCDVDSYTGLEIDSLKNRQNKKADFFYSGGVMPFSDREYDSLLSNQVFEHVFNPSVFLKELNRVLKESGMLLITVPFVWDEHEQPYDYARYSSYGLKYLLESNGFEIVKHRKSNNGIEAIFQLLNSYIYKVTITENRTLNLLVQFFLISPLNILGLILSKILPINNDLYLDNIILAKKIKNV